MNIMKKNIFKVSLIIAAAVLLFSFEGCDSEKPSSDSSSQTAAQTETSANQASSSVSEKETDIKALHYFDPQSSDPFSGAWRITEGEGSKLEDFVFLFDGHGEASIVIDTMGYCGKYSLDNSTDKNGNKISTFTTQLMFGLNGTYTYEFSNENSMAVLTNTENQTTSTLERLASFDFIPIPDPEPEIDESILGAWYSDDGEYFYFDKNGIMYQNQYGTMFTYFKYSAKDNVITATYTMQKEITDTYNYSVDGDTLKLNDYEYKRIPASELK